jgi:hypothetical protein
MTALALTRLKTVRINRTELRDNLRAKLDQAQDCTIIEISAPNDEDERVLLDKKYFDKIMQQLRAVIETLDIMSDQKLFKQIVGVAQTLEEDTRLGRLHSFDEAFGEE